MKSRNWVTYFNRDTVPTGIRALPNVVYTSMILVDLLKPTSSVFDFDSVFSTSMKYVSARVNPQTGLLKFFNYFQRMPEDADDTGLYWWLAGVKDSTLAHKVVDTLATYRSENGLYFTWFNPDGIPPGFAGSDRNPCDFMANVHIFLALQKYAPHLADSLCSAFLKNDIVSNPKFWTYNKRCPWLYYIRQIDLANYSCTLSGELSKKVACVKGQEIYIDMAKLIGNLALNKDVSNSREKAQRILLLLAKDEFEFFDENPIMLYHNDLEYEAPSRYWSYDVPLALWLRLYYEYKVSMGEF